MVFIALIERVQGYTKVYRYNTVYGEKNLAFLSVCKWRDSTCRNYMNRLKCGPNVCAAWNCYYINFGVRCPNCFCTGIDKYLNTIWPMEGNSLNLVLSWLLWIKFNEIYIVTLMLSRIVCFKNKCALPKSHVYRAMQININTLQSMKIYIF